MDATLFPFQKEGRMIFVFSTCQTSRSGILKNKIKKEEEAENHDN